MRVAFLEAGGSTGSGWKGPSSVMIRGTGGTRSSGSGGVMAPPAVVATKSGGGGGVGIVEEVYRVRLPHNTFTGRGVVVGEGKPENQSHAVIFAFGEALQTIDMNQVCVDPGMNTLLVSQHTLPTQTPILSYPPQDGCLAEALKTRNLLAVSAPSAPISPNGCTLHAGRIACVILLCT